MIEIVEVIDEITSSPSIDLSINPGVLFVFSPATNSRTLVIWQEWSKSMPSRALKNLFYEVKGTNTL
jgi:hypothetical protein